MYNELLKTATNMTATLKERERERVNAKHVPVIGDASGKSFTCFPLAVA